MKKTKILALSIGLLFLVVACAKTISIEDTWLCNASTGEWEKHGNPKAPKPTEECKRSSAEDQANISINSPNYKISTPNIIVESPLNEESVSSPFTLKGQARVFENQLSYKLTDSKGIKLAEGSLYANSPDVGQFGDFSAEVSFPTPTSVTGILEVLNYSAKDGTKINEVTIPVKFDVQTITLKVYFNNNKLDPEITCRAVFPVDRTIAKTPAIGAEIIKELLKGPTQEEKDEGYSTLINPWVTLKSLKIIDGVAYADFDEKLQEKVGGSCRVGAIRAEITETLKQFSTIKSVVISVEGDSETSLQP